MEPTAKPTLMPTASNRCPICGQYFAAPTFPSHLETVHPAYYEARRKNARTAVYPLVVATVAFVFAFFVAPSNKLVPGVIGVAIVIGTLFVTVNNQLRTSMRFRKEWNLQNPTGS